MASFLYNGKNGVSIIDSIPHCHNENASKKGKNQDNIMWLHFYIEHKIGVSIIDSIPHCLMKCFQKAQKSRNVASFLYRIQNLSIYHR